MTIMSSARRPFRRCLTAVGIASSVIFTGTLTASAGECPAKQVVADGQGQKMGATKPKSVTDNVLTRIDLVNEPVMLKDHALRLRRLVVQPGGIVPWHTHTDRPAIIYIISGDRRVSQHLQDADRAQGRRVDGGGQGHVALVEEHRQEDGRADFGRHPARQEGRAHDVRPSMTALPARA